MVLASITSVQIGNAWADSLFKHIDAGGAGLLRLAWAMVILLAIYRPRLSRRRDQWLAVAALGVVLAGMNLAFYHAIQRLPLGIAVTVEFIGPLAVAVTHSRRRTDGIWVLLAALGIVALAHGHSGHHLSVIGLLLAAGAGGLWGLYILAQARLGEAFADGSGLALAMVVATAVALPDGIIEGGSGLLHPGVLAVGAAVGLLSSVIPYSIELQVLRRLTPGLFGVLMSLEPAAAAIAGAIILGQGLTGREVVGVALVSAASFGASLGGGQAAAAEARGRSGGVGV